MADYNSLDSPYRLDEQHGEGYSPEIADTLRSLKVEIRVAKKIMIESFNHKRELGGHMRNM